MKLESVILRGDHIRLEPLSYRHVDGLVEATRQDRELFRWTIVPRTRDAAREYVRNALAWQEAGTALPFATVRQADGVVVGTTRFWNAEYWAWPVGHARHERGGPDAAEIGWTWLAATAVRTGANTEAKLLMLDYAFSVLGMLRICFHTDVRNERSKAALGRIGAQYEGVLRSHRMAADFVPRDSARFSILAAEWPAAAEKLRARLRPVPA